MALQARLSEGEMVLLCDPKSRRYLVTLASGKEFHTHSGLIPHDEIISANEGATLMSSKNVAYIVLRPTLADFVVKMPRGAQVIYPKDIAPILMMADIVPGAKVLESGIGSGALSMGMLRAGAEIVGYELREDFAHKAQKNISQFLGDQALEKFTVEIRDCYDGIDETDVDRVVLDLPEPWNVCDAAFGALRSGGIIVSYSPSITQVVKFRESLQRCGFIMADTTEVLHRGWHIENEAVRPDHRMVAHTGFLTVARRPDRDK